MSDQPNDPPSRAPAPNDPARQPRERDSLFAPWRLPYLEGTISEQKRETPEAHAAGSFLARYWAEPDRDEQNHVIARHLGGMILLNRYPYANGHLLIALGEPRPTLLDYDPSQRAHLWRLIEIAVELMRVALEPQGVNVGINQGSAAGAGVPEHLHAHVVPRWAGDVNFMETTGRVRVIPASLEAMAARYRAAWATLEPGDDPAPQASTGRG